MTFSVHRLAATWIGALVMVSCVNVEIVPTEFPYEAMLSQSDLGPDWIVEQTSFPRVDGAQSSYSLTLRHHDITDPTQPSVAHQLTIYPDAPSAIKGYSEFRDEFVPDRLSDPSLDISPSAVDDLSDSYCERVKLNKEPRIYCAWVQQHGNLVSVLQCLVDERALTFEQFGQIVGLVDTRLDKAD
jgi:hypothetical protein